MPRSGKSTYCEEWVRESRRVRFAQPEDLPPLEHCDGVKVDPGLTELIKNAPNYFDLPGNPRVIVAGDDFRIGLHGQAYLLDAECQVFASMDVAIRALLHRGFDVIVDETCTTEDTLSRYLRLDLDFTPVFIETPAEVCIERALKGGKEYLVKPIENMARQLADLRPRWDETRARLTERLRQRYPYAFPRKESA